MGKAGKKAVYSESEKTRLVEAICELYEANNFTIESCCEATGVIYDTFYLWIKTNPEYKERYKKAKSGHEENFFENILKPKALRAIEVLLDVQDVEETKIEDLAFNGIKTGDTKTTVTKTVRAPNPTAVIFAMKGVFPDRFKERHEINGSLTVDGSAELSPEKAAQIVKLASGE